jgi:hypothetical protein
MPKDLHGLSGVSLMRHCELNDALAMPMVKPVEKRRDPLAGLVLAGK